MCLPEFPFSINRWWRICFNSNHSLLYATPWNATIQKKKIYICNRMRPIFQYTRVCKLWLLLNPKVATIYHPSITDPYLSKTFKTSTNVIGRLARTEFFFYHFSIFFYSTDSFELNKFNWNQQLTQIPQWIHLDSSMNSVRFLNEFTQIPQ